MFASAVHLVHDRGLPHNVRLAYSIHIRLTIYTIIPYHEICAWIYPVSPHRVLCRLHGDGQLPGSRMDILESNNTRQAQIDQQVSAFCMVSSLSSVTQSTNLHQLYTLMQFVVTMIGIARDKKLTQPLTINCTRV